MSTRFIIGRAGSGKTHYLHEQIVRHIQHDPINRSVIVLVPKQTTFIYEQAIARDPRLGGYIQVHVVAPDDLAELALVETGSPHSARLDSVGRSLILGHLLRSHASQLPYFKNSAHTPGLAGEIDASFSEFERAGRDLASIDQIITDAQSSNQSDQQAVARKLIDLRHLYKLYQDFVASHGFDPFDRQQKAHQAIENCKLVQQSMVVIDDFYDFTTYERKLICSLAKTAQSVSISLLFDPKAEILNNPHHQPDEMGVFFRTELAYRKLYFDLHLSNVILNPPELMQAKHRFKSTNLKRVEADFELGNRPPVDVDGTVQLQLASDMPDEVSAAATHIQKLLASGYRMREIAVLARSVDEYEPFINTLFSEYQIAYFVDKRRSALHHPLMRAMQAIGRLVHTQWGNDAVMELCRSGLIGISQKASDLLEDYLNQHNLNREAWTLDQPWNFHKTVDEENERRQSHFSDSDVMEINSIRLRLRKTFAWITNPDWIKTEIPVKNRVNDLFAAINELGIPTALVNLIDQAEKNEQLQQAREFELGWTKLIELTDQLVDLLGETTITGQQFFSLIQTSLDEMELAITPPTVDQVLIGSIERTRTSNPKAVIFLGMNADQFPLAISEQAVLNDRDRKLLNKAGVEVEPPSKSKILQEQMLGYLGLTRASEQLILIRTERDDEGNEKEPSPFWIYVELLIKNVPPFKPLSQLDKINTPSRLVINLLEKIRASELETDLQIGMYNWLSSTTIESIQKVRDRAWPSLSYINDAKLSEPIRLAIFQSPLHASVSRIESYASCPFQHFARYGLRLQEPARGDISAIDLGNLYHSVLEKVVRKTIEKHLDFATSDQITPYVIHTIAQEAGESLRNQIFLSTAQNRYTLEHLEEVVGRLIHTQQSILKQGTLRPAFVELEFGSSGQLPPLTLETKDKKQIILNGKIDRIDIDLASSKYTVIDYKLSGQTLDLGDVVHGLMLQLLTYLLVINAGSKKLAGQQLSPAAAFYVKVARDTLAINNPDEAPDPTDPKYIKPARPNGVINLASKVELDQNMDTEKSSDFYAMNFKKDGTVSKVGSQLVTEDEFDDLVKFVEAKIISLCQSLMAGDISIAPYLIDKVSPCPRCSYNSVCRFDRLINSYRRLESLNRETALNVIKQEVRGGQ